MTHKQTVLAFALGIGLVAGASANSVVDYGPILVPHTYSNAVNVSGSFSDIYMFSVSKPTSSTGGVLSVEFLGSPLGITGLSAQLFLGKYTDNIPDKLVYTLTGSDIAKTGFGTYDPGDYYYTISGTGNGGKAGGIGAGVYSFTVTTAPVPEPESYAMLIAGLGVMWTIARRRSKTKNV